MDAVGFGFFGGKLYQELTQNVGANRINARDLCRTGARLASDGGAILLIAVQPGGGLREGPDDREAVTAPCAYRKSIVDLD